MEDNPDSFQKIKHPLTKHSSNQIKCMERRHKCPESGKVSYETKKIALYHVKSVEKKIGHKTEVYKCKHCKNFHLTTVRPHSTRHPKQTILDQTQI